MRKKKELKKKIEKSSWEGLLPKVKKFETLEYAMDFGYKKIIVVSMSLN